jgi:hypothetical protein
MALSREELLAIKPHAVAVEIEGHGKVYLKGLDAKERDDYEQSLIERGPDGRSRSKEHQENIRAGLVLRCVCDENGERLLADDDLLALGQVDGAIIDKLWDEARKLSGMAIEEIDVRAEGFGSAQDGNSSST